MTSERLRRLGHALLSGAAVGRVRRTAAWRLARYHRSDRRLRLATGAGLAEHATGQLLLLEPPATLTAGQPTWLAIHLANRAAASWPATGPDRVSLAAIWYDAAGQRIDAGEPPRNALPRTLHAGDEAVAGARVLAPARPGRYRLRVTLVREGLAWFDLAPRFAAAEIWVEVASPPADFPQRLAAAKIAEGRDATVRRLLYQDWLRSFESLTDADRARVRAIQARWDAPPTVWVLTTAGTGQAVALASVLAGFACQLYPHWRGIWLGQPDAAVRQHLEAAAAGDCRILPRFGATPAEVLAEADDRDLCLLLPADAALPELALHALVRASRDDPAQAWFSGDEDRLHPAAGRFAPDFKARGGLDFCLSSVAPLRPLACRVERLRAAGGVRLAEGQLDDQDLAFRLLERHGPPLQLAQVLCHRHAEDLADDRPGERDSETLRLGTLARQAYLDRQGGGARLERLPDRAAWRVRRPLPRAAPRVAVIIPTRDRLDLLGPCLESLWQRTDYPALEILVVDNQSVEPATLAFLARHEVEGRLKVLRYDAPFNWSAINNAAARATTAPLLCLLNNDTEAIEPGWLAEMVSQALRPEIGVVGAGLWHADDTLQHGGATIGGPFCAQHWGKGLAAAAEPYYALGCTRQVSAVTGACLVLRREVLERVGGIEERALQIGLSDVDLCLRVQRDLSLAVIWTPFARLRHHERATRGRRVEGEALERLMRERSAFRSQHYEVMADDPHAHPNLGLDGLSLSGAPRAPVRPAVLRDRAAGGPPLAFLHIPKTAGTALRHRLLEVYPGPGTFWLSARNLLLCYEGNPEALELTRRRASRAQAWVSHFSQGFDRLIGVPAVYATVLREPQARVLSHHAHLVSGVDSPLRGSRLAELGPAQLLRLGVIPGNLMVRRLAGLRPEMARWQSVVRGTFLHAGGFCGFALPEAVWRGEGEALMDRGTEVPPDEEALLDRALEALERDYAFVACQEDLDSAIQSLGGRLGWARGSLARFNESRRAPPPLSAADRRTIAEYNRLDAELYRRIRALPGRLLLRPERLPAPA